MSLVVDETLLRMGEVAQRLRVSARSVARWVFDGRLRSVKVGGRRRVPESAVGEFVAACSGTISTQLVGATDRREAAEKAAKRLEKLGI